MTDIQDRIAKLTPKRLALLAVELHKKVEAAEQAAAEPVAILGIGCRFPGGADSAEKFWKLLRDGVDAIKPVPPDRWQIDDYYDQSPDAQGKMVSRAGGFVADIDKFDARFFGITPREAVSLDPRYRILLEVAWEALENAAQAPDELTGSHTGVFVGACGSEYMHLLLEGPSSNQDGYLVSGCASSMAAGRIAYCLGTQGPALTLDTACSSSLVAVHQACQSLRAGECRMALAGGTSLILRPEVSVGLSQAGMLSPGDRCRAFDALADGIVRGEGCGLVVLKRLGDAQADGDTILAVIRGTAVNQDGRSSGITAPNGPAQVAVIRTALKRAGVAPRDIDYVETHGTGTSLGDPIEIRALGAVLGDDRPAANPVAIGSVKTNFGHLEASAGIAGLIKVVLSLQHAQIPPHLHLTELNPHVQWDQLPVTIPTQLTPWNAAGKPRTAGVSSFGFSGTNAHVILEEAPAGPALPATDQDRHVQLLTLSAKTEGALQELAKRYASDLYTGPLRSPGDICFTANACRAQFDHRIAVVGETVDQLAAGLSSLQNGRATPEAYLGRLEESDPPQVVFLFTGQGSQYVNMGRELFETEPVFRRTVQHCDEILRPILDRPLTTVLYPMHGGGESSSAAIDQTAFTQPAIFALEYALAQLWRSWGVEPTVVLGHSLGEYVAACVAGVFSLEDGLQLVTRRARLMQDLPAGGAMAAVFANEELVAKAISAHPGVISIAAVNGPENTVISGVGSAVEDVLRRLDSAGIGSWRLSVSHAFHSVLVEPMLDELQRTASEITMSEPEIGIVSNLTGELVEAATIASASYWRRHTRQPVRFSDSMHTLHQQGYRVFIEVGPSPILISMGQQILADDDAVFLPSLRPSSSDCKEMLKSLAGLYVRGAGIDWPTFHQQRPSRKVTLPTYPFERKRHWAEPPTVNRRLARGADRERWRDWLYELKWRPRASRRPWGSPADFLESPAAIAAGVRQHIDPLSDSHHLEVSREFASQLDVLCTSYILRALDQLGWDRSLGIRITADALRDQLGILPQHARLVERLLQILSEDGVLRPDGNQWEVVAMPETSDPVRAASDLLKRYPECSAELNLTSVCGQSLAEALTGRLDPLQLLFPQGSMEPTEKLYQEALPLRVLNSLLREAVAAAINQLPEGQLVRILEIGAGTGASSSFLLPALPRDRVEYVYTDVSNAFLTAAKRKFSDYPFVSYQLLDIGTDPEAQGYIPHDFDLVIAANVLHATPDLRKTLTHVRRLLAPQGLLMLLEGTKPPRFGDLTVGLTPGWWSFTDADLRPSYALLSADRWRRLLAETGFAEAIDVLGDHVQEDPILSQSAVLLARGPEMEKAAAQADGRAKIGDWLILCDENGFGDRLAGLIRARGGGCYTAVKGETFQNLGAGAYSLDPTCRGHFERLLAAVLHDEQASLRGVVHLFGLDEQLAHDAGREGVEATQERGCGGAIYLVQSLAACRTAAPPRVVLVTQAAQPVGEIGLDGLSLAQTTLWGLGRVIGLEHPEYRPLLVDLDPLLTDASAPQLLQALLSDETSDDQIAFRGGHKFALRIAASETAERREPTEVRLQPQATYLVTGGLAGLGLLVAEWLVDRGARHLVLSARSSPTEGAREALAAMERAGARITVAQADVADYDRMADLLNQIDSAENPLRGIIHCAGVLDDGILLQQDWARFRRVMASKVNGSWNLHQLSCEQQLDFFVLFSSGASFTGSPGQSNHAAANAFMDALAHHRRAQGLPGLSINWGPWSETGAAQRTGVVARSETKGLNTISPTQGLQILAHLLGAGSAQVAVLPLDAAELIAHHRCAAQTSLYEELSSTARLHGPLEPATAERPTVKPQLLSQLRIASPGRRPALVLQHVQEEATKIMALDFADAIDPRQPLTDLGLDSLMAVELRNAIGELVGKALPATLLFDHPSLDKLTTYLLDDVLATELATVRPRQSPPKPATSDVADNDELDLLSEDEMADLLAEQVENLKDI